MEHCRKRKLQPAHISTELERANQLNSLHNRFESDLRIQSWERLSRANENQILGLGDLKIHGAYELKHLPQDQDVRQYADDLIHLADRNDLLCICAYFIRAGIKRKPIPPSQQVKWTSDLWMNMLSFLSVPEILTRITLTCKAWFNTVHSPDFWYSLQELSLSALPYTQQNLLIFMKNLPDVKILDLQIADPYAHPVTDNTLQTVAVCFSRLEQLVLPGSDHVTDRSLEALANNCQDLIKVDLRNCVEITDEGIQQLVTHCSNIQDLCVRGCYQLTDLAFQYISTQCPKLKALDAGRCAISDDGFRILIQCHNLEVLDVFSCRKLTDEALRLIQCNLPKLTSLKVANCPNITALECALLSSLRPQLALELDLNPAEN